MSHPLIVRTLKMAESPNVILREVGVNGAFRMVAYQSETLSSQEKVGILDACLVVLDASNAQQFHDLVPTAIKTLVFLVEEYVLGNATLFCSEAILQTFLETDSAFSTILPYLSSPVDKIRVSALEIIGFAVSSPVGRGSLIANGGFISLVSGLGKDLLTVGH